MIVQDTYNATPSGDNMNSSRIKFLQDVLLLNAAFPQVIDEISQEWETQIYQIMLKDEWENWTPQLGDALMEFIMERGQIATWWSISHSKNSSLQKSQWLQYFNNWIEIDFADWFKEITMRNLLDELDWDTDYLNLCTGRVSKNLASTYDATVQDWWDEAQNIWNDTDLDEDETEVAIHDYINSLNWNSIAEEGLSWLINYVDEDDYAGIWDKVQAFNGNTPL